MLLSRTYGWTPQQISELTREQVSIYLQAVRVEKDDPALEYESEETPEDIEMQAAKLGLKMAKGKS
jgi:hypothetical protein